MRSATVLALLWALALGGCALPTGNVGARGVEENPPVEEIVAEEPERPAFENARVLLENLWVTVTEVTLPPGERLTFHRGGERIVYALSDHELRFIPEGAPQKATVCTLRQGQVQRQAAGPLTVENTGDRVARALVVNRSSEALPPAPEPRVGRQLADVGPRWVETLLSGDEVRVLRVDLPPGETLPRHRGAHRVIYSLGPYDLKYGLGDSDLVEVCFGAGDAHWHDAGDCSVENLGDAPARYLLFTFGP